MQYTNYKALVCRWGVELKGWTEPEINNPGNLAALSLNRLLNALRTGNCHWSKLTTTAWGERSDAQDVNLLEGNGKKRATCSDKGKSKKRKRGDKGRDMKYKSAEIVDSTDDDDDNSE
jgi:hypothetical protein